MRILLAYDSLSGNTREASRLVHGQLAASGHDVAEICVSTTADHPTVLAMKYDLHLLGTWTGGLGRTPAGMKSFVARLSRLPSEFQPKNIALFGTGETQWGMQWFCGALDRLAAYYKTEYPLLKLEQMPSGDSSRRQIAAWVAAVLARRAAASPA
jgi:predicted ribonucleotide reductase-associated flavodoxin